MWGKDSKNMNEIEYYNVFPPPTSRINMSGHTAYD